MKVDLNNTPKTWSPPMLVRAGKLNRLTAGGINPYLATRFDRTHTNRSAIAAFQPLADRASAPETIRLAGRIISLRDMGKIIFAHIEDESGRIQIYLSKDKIGVDKFDLFREHLEVGDFIGLEGTMFLTKRGELTVDVKDFTILCKSIRPLPEKFHGLKDEDVRQRQRYLDLASNPAVREVFRTRSRIVSLIRRHLDDLGFSEFETPILQDLHGGASARPFTTHHNALDSTLFLRIATELHLKRLIVGGFDAVYELGKVFRNEGIDTKHNPEFTTIEIYWAYKNYEDMMTLTEQMISRVVLAIHGKHQIPYGQETLDFTPPWKRLTMEEALAQIGGVDVTGLGLESLKQMVADQGLDLGEEKKADSGWIINALFERLVEGHLIQPTFITRYPAVTTPLAKRCPDNPDFVERFEAFAASMELANAFSELNDPIDQRERFAEQQRMAAAGDQEAQPYDEDFIQAIEVGMPPTGGLGIGIDRLAMMLTNSPSIRDVILFPTMKKRRS